MIATITVKNGLVVIPNQEVMDLLNVNMHWPRESEIVVGKEFIIYNVDVAEPVVQQYNQIYGGVLQTPPKKKIIVWCINTLSTGIMLNNTRVSS